MYHLNSCAAMHGRNLHVHQWLMNTPPHLAAEYIQYNDSKPFQPLQLQCAVDLLEVTVLMHGKLTTVVRY